MSANAPRPGLSPLMSDAWEIEEQAVLGCWRCGQQVLPREGRCPLCRAQLHEAARSTDPPLAGITQAVSRVLWAFAGLLVISLFYGWCYRFGVFEGFIDRDAARRSVYLTGAIEAVATCLVLLAWLRVPRLGLQFRTTFKLRIATWSLAIPMLAAMLGLNWGYHWLLRQLLSLPVHAPVFLLERDFPGWALEIGRASCRERV